MTVFSDIHIIEYVLILLAVVFMTVAIVLLTYHVVLLYIYAIAISRACDRSIAGKCSRDQRNRKDGRQIDELARILQTGLASEEKSE